HSSATHLDLHSFPTLRSSDLWDNRRDSLEIAITDPARPDTIQVVLADMEEKSYTFEVFTRDGQGNISVKSEILGTVYGDTYRNSLLTRAVRNLSVSEDTLVVDWMPAEETSIGDSLIYEDTEGKLNRLFVSSTEDTTK